MRCWLLLLCVIFSETAWGNLASVEYVDPKLENKVDVSESAKQTLKGEYTVTGTLYVPTPPLPPED